MTWGQLSLTLSRRFPSAQVDEIAEALTRAYDGVLRERRWQALTQSLTLVTAQPETAGTVSVTQASASVTGDGTAWTSAMAGRRFRIEGSNELYFVSSVESATALTLHREFEEATDTGLSYRITQDTYTLPLGVREVVSVGFPGLQAQAEGVSLADLERFCPAPGYEGPPRLWAYSQDTPDDYSGTTARAIRLAPTPDAVYGLPYVYLAAARGFDGSNTEESPLSFVDLGALIGAAQLALAAGGSAEYQAAQVAYVEGLRRMKNEDNRLAGPQRFAMAKRFVRHRINRWAR